ncbi:hypothetical protein RJ639_046618 [Escallonia herrerae]|uniref:Bromo domain-containing protein n=1 Tax=Escallonia herrerae TaxID=1293975 RepID=A0AA88W8C8_9ASTE|nr:hypothetical protein RJ639_046618 [Escallonia herrerae]
MPRSMGRNGHKRRTALGDKWKANQNGMQEDDREEQGPPTRTRARLKRKLEGVAFNSVATKAKQSHSFTAFECLLNGHPLEYTFFIVVLKATLPSDGQRDTYEIFAEPVDPEEVEDYYEIIKEPMDFGTMRAKLHEGMYKTLEQFEHDAFLISENAMHFNSSATIFFRQARAIHELAKNVFHVLKTDPENLKSEFSGTRRRSSRRLQGGAKELKWRMGPRPSTDGRPDRLAFDTYPKGPLSGPSIFRRNIGGDPGFGSTVSRVNVRDLPGSQSGARLPSFAADRRDTYKPWMLLQESDSIMSKTCSVPKALDLVNQQDISYRKSLMMFAKDLGPTAQRIAIQKLRGLSGEFIAHQTPRSGCGAQAPLYQNPTASSSTQNEPRNLDTTGPSSSQKLPDLLPGSRAFPKPASDIIDLTDTDEGEKAYNSNRTSDIGAPGGEFASDKGGLFACGRTNYVGTSRIEKLGQNQSTRHTFGSYSFNVGAANLINYGARTTAMPVDAAKLDDDIVCSFKNHGNSSKEMTVAAASEHAQASISKFKSRSKHSSAASSWLSQPGEVSSLSHNSDTSSCPQKALVGPSNGVSNSSEANHSSDTNRHAVPSASPFTFDLPFLKSRLTHMNPTGQDRYLQPQFQRAPGTGGPLFNSMAYKMAFMSTSQAAEPSTLRPSFGTPDTDLALQL